MSRVPRCGAHEAIFASKAGFFQQNAGFWLATLIQFCHKSIMKMDEAGPFEPMNGLRNTPISPDLANHGIAGAFSRHFPSEVKPNGHSSENDVRKASRAAQRSPGTERVRSAQFRKGRHSGHGGRGRSRCG
eukprot:scaffold1021_cov241-Pinguiococcus_pyrenoidosus.AAC.7